MNIPKCVEAFFEADRRADVDGVVAAMAAEASVADERKLHVGRDAIRAWWLEAKRKTPHVNEPLDAETDEDVTRVRVRVSGEFPGSPVTLQFAFTVQSDRIVRLEIT